MQDKAPRANAGFTLTEVLIASVLLAIAGGGFYGMGITLARMIRFDTVATEAREWGVERMEELIDIGLDGIAAQAPFEVQTRMIRGTARVDRRVGVVGHTADCAVVPLSEADYAEVIVDVVYHSPVTAALITNSFVTLVR